MKILIVDDDKTSRELLRKFVSTKTEHQVTTAADGDDAWMLLDDPSRYFDVAFIDLMMPEPDGFELVRRIRASAVHSSLQIVVCTGSNDRATIAKAIQAGVRHYLVKPLTEAVVAAKLRQLVPVEEPVPARRVANA